VPGPLSRGKSGLDVALTTHLHLAPRLKKEQSYNLLPLWAFMACSRNGAFSVPSNEIYKP